MSLTFYESIKLTSHLLNEKYLTSKITNWMSINFVRLSHDSLHVCKLCLHWHRQVQPVKTHCITSDSRGSSFSLFNCFLLISIIMASYILFIFCEKSSLPASIIMNWYVLLLLSVRENERERERELQRRLISFSRGRLTNVLIWEKVCEDF